MGERPAVLIVEDNPADRKLIRILLELEGWEVRTTATAEEALAGLAGFEPRLLILDLDLPGMSGLEFARRLKEAPQTARLPILATSASAGAAAAARALAAGCDAFLPKPLDQPALAMLVARWGKGEEVVEHRPSSKGA